MKKYFYILFLAVLIKAYSVPPPAGSYTTNNVTGAWEDSGNWSNLPNPATDPFDGILSNNSYQINGTITRNGDITQGVNLTVNDELYVTGNYTANGGSITIQEGARLQINGNFNGQINVTIEKGGYLIILGNYSSTGGTLTIKGSGPDEGAVIIGGDYYSSSNTTVNNQGNLVVGGDFTDVNGNLKINGSDNTDQVYFIGENPQINNPGWNTDLCTSGVCEYGDYDDLLGNDPQLKLIVDEVLGLTGCTIEVTLSSKTDISCDEAADGTIDLTVSNGSGSETYLWSDGNTSLDRSGLAAGFYSFTVEDGACSDSVENIEIVEPDTLTLSTVSVTNVTCNGGSDGIIDVAGSGGTPAYQYSIDGTNYQAVGQFSGLSANTYAIYVKDNNSCISSINVTITEPAPLTTYDFDFVIQPVSAFPSCKWTIEEIAWDNLSNISVTVNDLTKISSDNNWNGNAFGNNELYNNDQVYTIASETNRHRAFGLSNTDDGDSRNDIDFCFHLRDDGTIQIFENGNNRGDFGAYSNGDTLLIKIYDNRILYYKNSQPLYQSSLSPTFPLHPDVSMYDVSSTIQNTTVLKSNIGNFNALFINSGPTPVVSWYKNGVFIANGISFTDATLNAADEIHAELITDNPCFAGTLTSNLITCIQTDPSNNGEVLISEAESGSSCYQAEFPVLFDELSYVEANQNSLSKFYSDNNWNGGAFSFDSVTNLSYVYTVIDQLNHHRALGLSAVNSGDDRNSIDYAFHIRDNNTILIFENGNNRGDFGAIAMGDTLKILADNGVIKYYKGSAIIYESSVTPTLPLFVDVSVYDVNGRLSNINIVKPSSLRYKATLVDIDPAVSYIWKIDGVDQGVSSSVFEVLNPTHGMQVSCEVLMDNCAGLSVESQPVKLVASSVDQFGDFYITTDVSNGSCVVSYQEARFTDLQYIEAVGNDLRKYYSDNNWNGDAFSFNTVNNNSYVYTVIAEENKNRAIGLSTNNDGVDRNSIDYAVFLRDNKDIMIFENGINRGTFGSYVSGDTIKVAVEDNVVKYYKNSSIFYESSTTPTLPLHVDVSINNVNGTLNDITIVNATSGDFTANVINGGASPDYQWQLNGANVGSNSNTYSNASLTSGDVVTCLVIPDLPGCASGQGVSNPVILQSSPITNFGDFYITTDVSNGSCVVSYQEARFTDLQYIDAVGNDLRKYYSDNNWNGDAFSFNTVNNNSYVYTVIAEENKNRAIGLSTNNDGVDRNSIDYAVFLRDNKDIMIFENGINRGTFGSYVSGDTIKIAVEDNVVKYYKNSSIFYESSTTPTLPLHVDVSINNVNGTLNDITIVNATSGDFTANVINGGASPDYQWQLNGANVGSNSNTYSNASLTSGDVVTCLVIPDLPGCASGQGVSNPIILQSSPITNFGDFYITTDVSNGSCVVSYQEAKFTDLQYIEAVGNDLRKYYSDNNWNGDAFSFNTVNNNSYVYTVIAEENKNRAIGLSENNDGVDLNSIDYAVSLRDNKDIMIFENGINRGTFGSYVSGDTIKVAVEDNVVKYYKNSFIFYESSTTPTLPLHVDVSINNVNGTLNDITIVNATSGDFTANVINGGASPDYQWQLNGANVGSNSNTYSNASLTSGDVVTCLVIPDLPGCASGQGVSNPIILQENTIDSYSDSYIEIDTVSVACMTASEQVKMTGLNYVTINGSDITKYYSNNNWNGSAYGYNEVLNNQFIYTVVRENTKDKFIGLANSTIGNGYNNIKFGLMLRADGSIRVYESNNNRGTFGNYQVGDTIKIRIRNSVVDYYRNNVLLYTSGVAPTFPLYIDMSFSDVGAILQIPHIVKFFDGTMNVIPVDAGANPTYKWQLNGVNTGITTPTYSNADLVDGDIVSCIVTPDKPGCVNATEETVGLIKPISDNLLVEDIPPVVNAMSDVVVCEGDPINIGTPVSSDNCGVISTINDAPGSYPVGTTVVTWTIGDIHGNQTQVTQNIIINEIPVVDHVSSAENITNR